MNASSESRAAEPARTTGPPTLSLGYPLNPSALLALFGLSLRQQVRGWRLLVLCLLYSLPLLIIVVTRIADPEVEASALEVGLLFRFFPHALIPFAALLSASGMIQDEIEEQTLTYLLIRPLPKWALYVIKLLATIVISILLTAVFTVLAIVAIYWGTQEIEGLRWLRPLRLIGLFSLTMVAYCSLFGCLSLLVRRSLATGIIYIIALEGAMSSIDFIVRRFTVMYYFRVLSASWLDVGPDDWQIDLTTAPTALECVLTLLAASLVLIVVAAVVISSREFRMKTPEGS